MPVLGVRNGRLRHRIRRYFEWYVASNEPEEDEEAEDEDEDAGVLIDVM